MKNSLPLLFLALVLPACGGSGSQPIPASPSIATAAPSAAPGASASPKPSTAPSTAPSASPALSSAPTAAPTAVPALHVAGALASVFSTSGLVRRSAADLRRIQSTNLGNGQIPTVVGATSPYYGTIFTSMFVWAATSQNTPMPETTLQAVPTNAVSGPISVASVGQDNGNAFALTFFDWTVAFNVNKVGKGSVVATFGDGTTGSIPVYIYDQWYLTCGSVVDVNHPMEWAYTAGVPKGVFGATTDMTVDCTGLSVAFTNGASQSAAPVTDAWGNVASALTTITSGTTNAGLLTVPVASLKLGTIYIVKLADGGFAKIMPLVSDGPANAPNISGISLHDSPSGSGQFSL